MHGEAEDAAKEDSVRLWFIEYASWLQRLVRLARG